MGIESIQQRFDSRLKKRDQQNLYRHRPLSFSPQQPQMMINGRNSINFCSNDYLGLANHPDIKAKLISELCQTSVSYGAGAAHLVTGHHLEHHLLEDELADWLQTERALLFSTGYMANLGVLSTIAQKGDVIIGDKLNHASLIDGALHSEAEFRRYPHNDMLALESRLKKAQQKRQQAIVVTDGVFSMDGDFANIAQIQTLVKEYQAWLVIDDAHGFGVIGEQGRGTLSQFGINADENTIQIGTLGKAFGCSGAFVAGSSVLIETLIQFARSYIYTTASPQINAIASRCALKMVKSFDEQRQHLQKLIQQFREGASQLNLQIWPSNTAIQPIILGDAKTALNWSNFLQERGFWVAAIRPPTVPENMARLRITLSAAHTEKHVRELIKALADAKESL